MQLIDAEKLTDAVEKSKSPKEAFAAISKVCPSVDAKGLEKVYEFYAVQFVASYEEANGKTKNASSKVMKLTEGELEQVAGGAGSVGDWLGKNWKSLLVGVAIFAVAAVGCAIAGGVIGTASTFTLAQGVGQAIQTAWLSAESILMGCTSMAAPGIGLLAGAVTGMAAGGAIIGSGAAVVGAFAGGTIAALTHTGAAVASTQVGFVFVGFGAIVAKGVILGGAAGVALGGGVAGAGLASSLAAPAES